MTSVVAICNLALSNIGKENINALNEPTAEARACNQFYEHVRDMLLQAYPWRFAGKVQSLAELPNDKPGMWRHAYSRPMDCLKVRWVRAEYSSTPDEKLSLAKADDFGFAHEIEANRIYCDLSPAYLHYTFKLTDPTKFTPLFIEALSWHLSVRLAMPLTRDPRVREDCFSLANAAQAAAQEADANEDRETSDIVSNLVRARG